ncbi:MAG: lactonase family protein [Opitutae bacterium]|nr:lactonase family protein [Opitutae bacterium]
MTSDHHQVFLGCYTPKDGASRGLYAVRLNATNAKLGDPVLAAETANPTFAVLHPNGRLVYALGQCVDAAGRTGGAVSAFALDRDSGALAALNAQPTGGGGTSHLAVDATGRMLVTISYSGGDIATFPLGADGRIGARTGQIKPSGPLGPVKDRQDKPHPHSVTFSPDNRHAYVCDLAQDKILCYRVDPAVATLTPAGDCPARPGAGPRHAKFSSSGRFFYVINELDSTVATYACDIESGALTPKQTVPTLPAGYAGTNICAEIRIHPNGRFVYGSNRGHDSLAVYARDAAEGTLTLVEIVPCGGQHPRNFALSPGGEVLLCANRDTNNLTVFRVNAKTGRLTATGQSVPAFQAVCVLFAS